MKKYFLLMLLIIQFCLPSFAGNGTYLGEDPNTSMSNELLEDIVENGSNSQSSVASAILAERRRIDALLHKLYVLNDLLDAVDTQTGDYPAGTDNSSAHKILKEEIEKTEKELLKALANNSGMSLDNLDFKSAMSGGDPVKITRGSYEQNETDISAGEGRLLQITRQYDSGRKIESSFGYGWSTNLDQRIILGIQPGAQAFYDEKNAFCEELTQMAESLKETIVETYNVESLETAEEEIKQKIDTCIYIKNKAESLSEAAVVDTATRIRFAAEDKIDILNEILENLQADLEVLYAIEEDNEKAAEENEIWYTEKLLPSLDRKSRNARAMFYGMDTSYEETGVDTLTVIDETAYPHLLYETVKNSGVWINESDSLILKCVKELNAYTVYFSDGTNQLYDEYGFLIRITDRNGNYMNIIRDGNERILYAEDSFCERYDFTYSGKYISKITNSRSDNESVSYAYNGNRLTGVADIDGDFVTMGYDSTGRMTFLEKCDGSSVRLEYGLQTADGLVLATATTNEEGFTEHFEYDRSGKRTDYINHDGNKTSYWYDARHRTVREIRADGTDIVNAYDDYGNLKSVNENGNLTVYGYDSTGNKISASYSDGTAEYWSYDSFRLVISHTDRGGVKEDYLRDERGNLREYRLGGKTVFTQDFDSKGQVIKKTVFGQKPVINVFSYDSHGNLKSQTCGGITTEYEYDSRNRVTKISTAGKVAAEYEYYGHKTVQKNYNGLETVYLTNGRKDLVKVTQKDTVTGIIHETRIEYDRRHLPLRVYSGNGENEKLIAGYLYTPEGKLKAEVSYGSETWVKFYEYKNGQISEFKQFKVVESVETTLTEQQLKDLLVASGDKVFSQKYDYQHLSGKGKLITVTDALGITNLFEYDSFGSLVKNTDGNGEIREKVYGGGYLKREQSSHGGWYEYEYTDGRMTKAGEQGSSAVETLYYPDGTIKSAADRCGRVTYYQYDDRGRVSSIQSDTSKVWYEYDSFDRVIKQIKGNSADESSCVYYEAYLYSEDGRKIEVTEGGKYKTVYELDAFENVIKEIDGNANERSFVYNSLNQMTESYDGYGNKTLYEYNALGEVCKVTLPDGAETRYEYNYMSLLEKVTDGCGTVYSAAYDKAGRLIKERNRADSEKTYEYDNGGRITKVICGGEVVESYTYGNNSRTVTVKDGNGYDFIYKYDGFGRLVNERNRKNLEQNYLYDEDGQLKNQQGFDGSSTTISYSNDRTIKTICYSDGSESSFIYDMNGNTVEAQNAYEKTVYRYDQGGRLIYQKDITTGEEVYFDYDSAGNRIRLYSSNRETVYSYGKNNEVKEVFDNRQRIRITLFYDINGRETKRTFGNDTYEETRYDKAGRITVKMQKDYRGEVLWGEGYVYGPDGKRTATVDNAGRVTFYEYNQKGQLSAVYYPYSQETEESLRKDSEINGLPVTTSSGENRFLTGVEKANIVVLLNSMQYGLAYSLTNVQVVIKESYEYDRNGNRIAKITPYGKIEYNYDKENCLLSSGSKGQAFITYSYDAMGNLLTETSSERSSKYAYNAQNRLIYCEVIDKSDKTYLQTTYAYDAFGRRILVQDKGEAALRTIYDGFTFDVIKQSPTFENGLFTDTYNTGIKYGRTGKPTGDRYRYLEDNNNDGYRYFYLDEDAYKTTNSRYRGERFVINVNGSIAAQTTSDYGNEYFSTDLQGSIRYATDYLGSKNTAYTYDAFGTLIAGDLAGTSDFGYLGKQMDPTAKLYNYGYRDYKPESARFTSIDPIRDGSNWFAYVNNDPVNHIDLWGLICETGNDEDDSKYIREVFDIEKNGTLSIIKTIPGTDIIIGIFGARNNYNNKTKIDISLIVQNSVSEEPSWKGGMFSQYAAASSLTVTVISGNGLTSTDTVLSNSDETNNVTVSIPLTNNKVMVDIDIYVVAPNQNNAEEKYNYEVTFN